MNKPEFSEGVGSYSLRWDNGTDIDVTRVKQHTSDGRVTAEVSVRYGENGSKVHLHQAQLNLSSTAAREKLSKTLGTRVEDIDWYAAIEQTCLYVVEAVRRGEPVVELWGEETAERPTYMAEPLIIKGYPNIIFGDPGSFKSAEAALCIAIVTLPWVDNPLGLKTQPDPTTCLYLDWETDRATVNWTLSRLFRGHGLPAFPMMYRRCALPLAQDIEAIRSLVEQCEAQMVVIDSLGMASGGQDLNTSGTAIGFYTALRQLNVTSLILAHNSKDKESKSRSVIGHQYFTAQARNIWESKVLQEAGEDEIDLALFHRKAPPFAKYSAPIGMHVTFTEATMHLRTQSVTSMREFVADMGIKAQIRDALKDGALAVNDIASACGTNPNHIRTNLHRMKEQGTVVKLPDGCWGMTHFE